MPNRKSHRGRVASVNANVRFHNVYTWQPTLPLELPLAPSRSIARPSPDLRELEDRRTYHPLGPNRPAKLVNGSNHRLTEVKKNAPRSMPALFSAAASIAFQAPERVLLCIRRQRRKEVMHALRHAGRTGQRRPRRSAYSSISCKRG